MFHVVLCSSPRLLSPLTLLLKLAFKYFSCQYKFRNALSVFLCSRCCSRPQSWVTLHVYTMSHLLNKWPLKVIASAVSSIVLCFVLCQLLKWLYDGHDWLNCCVVRLFYQCRLYWRDGLWFKLYILFLKLNLLHISLHLAIWHVLCYIFNENYMRWSNKLKCTIKEERKIRIKIIYTRAIL